MEMDSEADVVGVEYKYVRGPYHWPLAFFLLYPIVLATGGTALSLYLQDIFFSLMTIGTSTTVWFLAGVVSDYTDVRAPDRELNEHWAAPEPILAWVVSWQYTLTILTLSLRLRVRTSTLWLVNLIGVGYIVALVVNHYLAWSQVFVTVGFAIAFSMPGIVMLTWFGFPLSAAISNSAFGYALGYRDSLGETYEELTHAKALREAWFVPWRQRWRAFRHDVLGWPC